MKLALLLAWLLMGGVDSDWWGDADTNPTETGDVSKMDGTDEPPPPKP